MRKKTYLYLALAAAAWWYYQKQKGNNFLGKPLVALPPPNPAATQAAMAAQVAQS